MKTVTIGEAKRELSALLRLVQQGQSILILDRKGPVARIRPVTSANDGNGLATIQPRQHCKMKALAFLCSLTVAAACFAAAISLSLTVADNGKTVPIKVGQQVTITLKGNPTTGYLWSVAGLSSNTVEQVGEVEYRRDEDGQHLVGSGGVFAATFKAVKPGPTTVRMEYRRPWEKDVPPVETFAVTLDVK